MQSVEIEVTLDDLRLFTSGLVLDEEKDEEKKQRNFTKNEAKRLRATTNSIQNKKNRYNSFICPTFHISKLETNLSLSIFRYHSYV